MILFLVIFVHFFCINLHGASEELALNHYFKATVNISKSSVGLRDEAFAILFNESGESVIPEESSLTIACKMLIESASLENPYVDTESTRWIQDLEKMGKIPVEDNLVKMFESGRIEDAARILSEIWIKAVREGQK
jgi:hypothetical protein